MILEIVLASVGDPDPYSVVSGSTGGFGANPDMSYCTFFFQTPFPKFCYENHSLLLNNVLCTYYIFVLGVKNVPIND